MTSSPFTGLKSVGALLRLTDHHTMLPNHAKNNRLLHLSIGSLHAADFNGFRGVLAGGFSAPRQSVKSLSLRWRAIARLVSRDTNRRPLTRAWQPRRRSSRPRLQRAYVRPFHFREGADATLPRQRSATPVVSRRYTFGGGGGRSRRGRPSCSRAHRKTSRKKIGKKLESGGSDLHYESR